MFRPMSFVLMVVLIIPTVVMGQPKNIRFVHQGISKLGLAGVKFTIECPLTGPFYLWRFFQPKFDSRVLLDQDAKNIILESATVDKTGIYECKSTTGFGNAVINITIKIIDPKIEPAKEICSFRKTDNKPDYIGGVCFLDEGYTRKSSYKMGSSTELDCDAVGNNLRYIWKFIDQNGLQAIITRNNNVSKLLIKNITPENEGTYKCEVMNDQGLKLIRSFPITITDLSSDSGIEVIGEKVVSYSLKYEENVSLVCEIRNKYQRIHSTKWGKRISEQDSIFTSNTVYWDQHNYRVLPATGISEVQKTQNEIISTLTLTRLDGTKSGIYICLAMNTFGGTVYKLFNITISNDAIRELSSKRSQFFFLYILSPAILILICICAIIYCCVKTNSSKCSNSMPLKQCNSSTPSNGNKTTTSNFYYPVTSSRSNTNCPPLPQPAESQLSQVSPNTLTSYSSYGNYHYLPSNQQSCYSSNGV